MTYRIEMQLTDRELLELAAKAIGFQLYVNKADASQLWKDGEYVQFWKPLDDDGDALRLAVKLNLGVMVRGQPQDPSATVVLFDTDCPRRLAVAHGDDPEAATRSAIVRAAAAIAIEKAMP